VLWTKTWGNKWTTKNDLADPSRVSSKWATVFANLVSLGGIIAEDLIESAPERFMIIKLVQFAIRHGAIDFASRLKAQVSAACTSFRCQSNFFGAKARPLQYLDTFKFKDFECIRFWHRLWLPRGLEVIDRQGQFVLVLPTKLDCGTPRNRWIV
jgi:hypothetical protein